MPKKKMVLCRSLVNKNAVRRETISGVEHIIVSSYTLPDDVVMNGGLYPAREIENSFETLERTLAPVEHPVDEDGNFLSASDPIAISDFYAGAYNRNVTRENGRVHIEKVINVQEALKTERGKRLLDRINELEESENPRPIHTSVGLFLEVEVLDKPKTNAAGDEYTWIGRNFVFDHDAILLDSVGAATPDDGVGIAVNMSGEKMDVERVETDAVRAAARPALAPSSNDNGISMRDLQEQLDKAIRNIIASDWSYVVDVIDDMVIFETNTGFYQVPFRVDDGTATVVGIPVRVDRSVTYTPKTNEREGDVMKDMIINALKEAGVDIEGMGDAALLQAYNNLNEQPGETDQTEAITNAVSAAVAPLTEKVVSLEARLNQKNAEESERLATAVINSGKYAGMSDETIKSLPLEELCNMAANCGVSHGALPAKEFGTNNDDGYSAPAEMPE